MKLIDCYKEWMETGELPEFPGGLCSNAPDRYLKMVDMFEPIDNNHPSYWADGRCTGQNKYYGFNPLRQTIVLFICAMKGEI